MSILLRHGGAWLSTRGETKPPDYSPPPPGGSRFPGDPGAGKIWYGLSSSSGSPDSREAQLGRRIGLFRTYAPDGESVPSIISRARVQHQNGRLPIISVKVPNTDWAAVASGAQDVWLDGVLDGLMALDQIVWFSMHHEPYDNESGSNTRAAWIGMHRRAKQKVAGSKIAICPILQSAPFTPSTTNGRPKDIFDTWYAKDACDMIGLDSYTHWYPDPPPSTYSSKQWREPPVCFEGWNLVQQFDKPVVYCEYGIRTDHRNPGRSAQWMHDSLEWMIAHGVVGMSYFDSDRNVNDGTPTHPAPPWDLDHGGTVANQILETPANGFPGGPERLNAFNQILTDPRVVYLP